MQGVADSSFVGRISVTSRKLLNEAITLMILM